MTNIDRPAIHRAPATVGDRSKGRAFTVIEMLVVLVIIGILAGIVITLAQRVTQGGKFAASKNVLQSAENMLTEYITTREAAPPMFVRTNQTRQNINPPADASPTPADPMATGTYLFPIVDGRFAGRPANTGPGGGSRFSKDGDPAQPAAALMLLALQTESSVIEQQLKGMDSRFLQLRDVYAYGWLVNNQTGEPQGQPVLRRLRIPVLIDAFGNPIRYVHPGFQGGWGDFWNNGDPAAGVHRGSLTVTYAPNDGGAPLEMVFTRSYRPFGATAAHGSVGDADEGLAIGGHGYFYSPGLDGDPGTREDNVYSRRPSFPTETAKLN